ncbi:MAG: hypothetical protein ACYC28_13985 [Longimicrobiales bacterium]
MHIPPDIIEEHLGSIIIDGQRCEMTVRSQPDDGGTWHNALIFRRDGRVAATDELVVGVEWHVPPGIALERANELPEKDRLELFQRAMRPRPPLL